MLAKVELPYRVIDIAAGDLGSCAARKFDCEAWLPTQDRYLELTSTSNCTTFQARRLDVRERDPRDGAGNRAVATLNGTLATTRWIVALLENHQQADGRCACRRRCSPTSAASTCSTGRASTRERPSRWLVAARRRRHDPRLRRGARDRVARGRALGWSTAGHHVVLATGRSLHGDAAGARPARPGRRAGRSAATAASTLRLDPGLADGYEIAQLVTFDPAPALRLLREHLPTALFAVEDVGVGFRLTAPFPPGELYGDLEFVDFEELLLTPATRVIVRSPAHTPEDFLRSSSRWACTGSATPSAGPHGWTSPPTG